MAVKLGNIIGEFLDFDNGRDDSNGNYCMRIKVEVDISKPLLRGFTLKANGIEGRCWVSMRYEKLPDYCFMCGRIGHVAKECVESERREILDEISPYFHLQDIDL